MIERKCGPWIIVADANGAEIRDTRDGKTARAVAVWQRKPTMLSHLEWTGEVPIYVAQRARSIIRRQGIAEHNRRRRS